MVPTLYSISCRGEDFLRHLVHLGAGDLQLAAGGDQRDHHLGVRRLAGLLRHR